MFFITLSKTLTGPPLINLLKIERNIQIQVNKLDIYDISRAIQLALPQWKFEEDAHISQNNYKTSFFSKNEEIKVNSYKLYYKYKTCISEEHLNFTYSINTFADLVKSLRIIRKTKLQSHLKDDICYGLYGYIERLSSKLDDVRSSIEYLTAISMLDSINKIESDPEGIIKLAHDIYHNRYDTIGNQKDYLIISKAVAERKNKNYLNLLEKYENKRR